MNIINGVWLGILLETASFIATSTGVGVCSCWPFE